MLDFEALKRASSYILAVDNGKNYICDPKLPTSEEMLEGPRYRPFNVRSTKSDTRRIAVAKER